MAERLLCVPEMIIPFTIWSLNILMTMVRVRFETRCLINLQANRPNTYESLYAQWLHSQIDMLSMSFNCMISSIEIRLCYRLGNVFWRLRYKNCAEIWSLKSWISVCRSLFIGFLYWVLYALQYITSVLHFSILENVFPLAAWKTQVASPTLLLQILISYSLLSSQTSTQPI